MTTTTSAPTDHQATDLREYIRVLRTRKWELLLVTLLVLAATLFFTLRQTPLYQGQAKVLVKPIQNPLSSQQNLQEPNLDTERQIILSQAVARDVLERVETDHSVDQLLNYLKVEVLPDTEVLDVKFTDPSPQTAARMANVFATTYVAFRRDQVLSQFETAVEAQQGIITGIRKQLNELNGRIASAQNPNTTQALQTERDTLVARLAVEEQRLNDLQSAVLAQDPAEILQTSEVPTTPVSPNKVRNGLFGLLAGLALGVGLVFLRERLDDRIKSRQEIEKRLGVPVIAAVPRLGGWRKVDETRLTMKDDPKNPVSEAYRTLGTNIQYIASRRPLKVLMITSALGGEGKTTTSANLAVVLAKAGKRVVLISADLRKPRIHKFFGLPNKIGLSTVLSNSTNLPQVAQDPGIENLRVIAGGPIPQDPAELLGSRRAGEFLDSLREVSDIIIIDTPPVLAVADASILAPLVDATIFVMDAEHSSRSAMVHARDQLENAGAALVGAVYNNFDPGQSAGYSSYYYYQYYGRPEEEPSSNGGGLVRRRRSRRAPTKSTGFDREAQPTGRT